MDREKKILQQLIEVVNPREKITNDRLRQVRARLKDYSAAELIASARELAKSDWHKENGQMSIDNLIRPSKIGRWYAASLNPVAQGPRKYAL